MKSQRRFTLIWWKKPDGGWKRKSVIEAGSRFNSIPQEFWKELFTEEQREACANEIIRRFVSIGGQKSRNFRIEHTDQWRGPEEREPEFEF